MSCYPYKHSTSSQQRPATSWMPAAPQPLAGTEVGLWRASGGLGLLGLLFHPLTLLCASCHSTLLVLASNS